MADRKLGFEVVTATTGFLADMDLFFTLWAPLVPSPRSGRGAPNVAGDLIFLGFVETFDSFQLFLVGLCLSALRMNPTARVGHFTANRAVGALGDIENRARLLAGHAVPKRKRIRSNGEGAQQKSRPSWSGIAFKRAPNVVLLRNFIRAAAIQSRNITRPRARVLLSRN